MITFTAMDDDLIAGITADVMTCLNRAQFFEKLDALFCPKESSIPRKSCAGDYKISEAILRNVGFDAGDLEDIFNVLRSQGGFCDCEILYNVAESSRLRSEYWRNRSDEQVGRPKHGAPSS